jgi:alpha-1,3-rhamnosyl/mannosyltransferase
LQLPLNLRQAYPLVLVGAVGWKVHELIDTIKAHSDTILLLGYLPEEDLSQLFSSAKAFCYLSTYEGFGLPVLEALASGVPVITAANTAMAEISSEQAILVDPLDIDAIQTGIQQILLDENCSTIANNLADYYRNNFSWKKCAKNTIEVIKNQVNDIGVL